MRKLFIIISVLLFGFCHFTPVNAQGQGGLTLSITPPLIKNNVNPGQVWKSAIKVINNNPREINIYIKVRDFKSGEERGTVEFIKNPERADEEDSRYFLSQWLVIDPGPVSIPAFQSKDIPFAINIPEDATPGGHYAAILAGTNPLPGEISGSHIKISSLLASLILLNIKGEVNERGYIREFSTDKRFYFDPEVDFTVRFENIGNVHVQPQGAIMVYNMFNEEVGNIAINHSTEFGNVLPRSIRKWQFAWQGENSLLAMGKYRAELILTYGGEAKETVDQKLYFWIVQPRPLLISFGVVLFVILGFVLLIRRYVKKAVKRSQEQFGMVSHMSRIGSEKKVKVIPGQGRSIDLKLAVKKGAKQKKDKQQIAPKYNWTNFKRLILIILIIVLVVFGVIIIKNYFQDSQSPINNNQPSRDSSQVDIINTEGSKQAVEQINSAGDQEQAKQELKDDLSTKEADATSTDDLDEDKLATSTPVVTSEKEIIIRVLNGSGKPGVANEVAKIFRDAGYKVESVDNAERFDYRNTIVKHKATFSQTAELISGLFDKPVDMQEVGEQEEDIVVIVGADH